MLTTPDEPMTCLRELRTRHPRNPTVLKGHYRLHDDRVTLVLKRRQLRNNGTRKREPESPEQTFHLVRTIDELMQARNLSQFTHCFSEDSIQDSFYAVPR